jgi:hypothetical protein
MSDSKTKLTRQEYQHLRDQAAAAIMKLGVEPWDAWEAVYFAEALKDRVANSIPMAIQTNRGQE